MLTICGIETLFSIFYQHPRDLLQELASIELTARDWRWHKVLRQWLQKDTHSAANSGGGGGGTSLPIVDLAGPAFSAVRVGVNVERGVYVFFDAGNWRRERREFVLDYGELDNRHAGGGPVNGAAAAGSGNGFGGVQQQQQAMPPTNGVAAGPAPGLTGGPVQAPTPAPGLSAGGAGSGVGSAAVIPAALNSQLATSA